MLTSLQPATQASSLLHIRPSNLRSVRRMSNFIEKYDAREPVDHNEYLTRWSKIWDAGVPKGQFWDQGNTSPALLDLIASGNLEVKGKRVLVPGCGRGYDVVAFAAAGAAESVGLEISSKAVEEASAYIRETLPDAGKAARMVEGDFFSWQSAEGPFDIGYDYTFGCAIHPSIRSDWAAGWARALKPGATLVTLIFPVDPARDPNIGPPFPISPELYQGLLPPVGFERISVEKVPEQLSHESRKGFEYLGLWRRM